MQKVITPEPHCVPGYGGKIPQYQYYIGSTYGKLTHRALLDPCIAHSKDINLTPIHKIQNAEIPTKAERDVLRSRERFVDAVYKDPMVPGYDGFVPRQREQIGLRHLAAATTALAENEGLMERYRCERRHLLHGDLLQRCDGLFERHIGERLIPTTRFRVPLIDVSGKRRGSGRFDQMNKITDSKVAYSKFTTPHFKSNDDIEKWIIYGYSGHIPTARDLIGMSSKPMTRVALNKFSDNYRLQRFDKMCNAREVVRPQSTNVCMDPDCEVYRQNENIVPFYGGHVPGRLFQVGKRFAVETTNAKDWLRYHKIKRILPPACGEQCR